MIITPKLENGKNIEERVPTTIKLSPFIEACQIFFFSETLMLEFHINGSN